MAAEIPKTRPASECPKCTWALNDFCWHVVPYCSHLEVGDEVFEVVQLQQSLLALRHDRHRNTEQNLGPVLCQKNVNDARGKGGRKGTAEQGEEPL